MKRIMVLMAVLAMTGVAVSAEDGLHMSVGGGPMVYSVYSGADQVLMLPIPNFALTYENGIFQSGLSIFNGLSMGLNFESIGLSTSLSANFGSSRTRDGVNILGINLDYKDEIAQLMSEAAEVSTVVQFGAELSYFVAIGYLTAGLEYHPTEVEQLDGSHQRYDGLVYNCSFMTGAPLSERFMLAMMFGVDFMNNEYADAWYSVTKGNEELDAYNADGGLLDWSMAVVAKIGLSERTKLLALASAAFLQGDAKDSPYTRTGTEVAAGLYVNVILF